MLELDSRDMWFVASLTLGTVSAVFVVCRACLRRKLEALHALWDDIYVRIVERCGLVGRLSGHLKKRLRAETKVVDDIEYLLKRMEETNDPRTHAAVQNGLVLTVQTAVEQFHRDATMKEDSQLYETMHAIGVVDARLAPLRDRFNDRVRQYNRLINMLPFSVVARLTHTIERSLFPMLIPWWSTDPAAYGSVSSSDIRQTLQTWRAPLILAPSQRTEWPGTSEGVIRVADQLLRKQETPPNGATPSAGPPSGGGD
ncbi:MAG: LemA family protein [Armatimonadetes bacterium]|nr:LemA family protein [Armatimonadota bacterium]